MGPGETSSNFDTQPDEKVSDEKWLVCIASVVFEESSGHMIYSIAPSVLSEEDSRVLSFLSIHDSLSSSNKSADTIH